MSLLIIQIIQILHIEPYKIKLASNNGEQVTVDMTDKLKLWAVTPNSKFAELLAIKMFLSVKLDAELETIYWDNGIDFCPDTLYQWAK